MLCAVCGAAIDGPEGSEAEQSENDGTQAPTEVSREW